MAFRDINYYGFIIISISKGYLWLYDKQIVWTLSHWHEDFDGWSDKDKKG